jgi:hypothetical protein
MIFTEPPSAWNARQEARRHDCLDLLTAPVRFESVWDFVIIEEVQKRAAPTRITSLVSELRKRHRHRDKRDKEAVKRTILLRIGALIRQKQLQRVRRKFIVVPK